MPITWTRATIAAVRRHVADVGPVFTRQGLIDAELKRIVAETGSTGATPDMTLSRELQQLRDAGYLAFVSSGTYRWRDMVVDYTRPGTSKGVFVAGAHAIDDDEPERFHRFDERWIGAAAQTVGQWIVYQRMPSAGRQDYYAVGRVGGIVPDGDAAYRALIEPDTFLEFGRPVPFLVDGEPVERGLVGSLGGSRSRAAQRVRVLSDEDFGRIVGLGLVDEDELLPRVDETAPVMLEEERMPWEGPVDRETALFSRKVRDRQFRKRVLDVYGETCAFTGMKLINGGGRAETQAAHIMCVKAGGPDVASNGLALSGTVHWMFDRGLLSLSDEGDILLSREINDVEGVERLLLRDRKARLPASRQDRPHPRYLAWHRSECFHG